MDRGMTVAEILASDKEMLSATDNSGILRIHPSRITFYAQTGQLPFPAMMSGCRAKIPKQGFLKFLGYGGENNERK